MAQQSVLLAPQVTSVEEGLARWNDSTHPFDPDHPRHQEPPTAADTLKVDNAQQVNVNKTNHPSILESNPNVPSPISGSPSASIRDSASTHSLPVLRVTEPQRSPALAQGPDLPSQSDDDGTTPVQRGFVSGAGAPPPSGRGNVRSRSAIDGRSSSRLSGFFSHLIHRRDNAPPPPGAVTNQERTNTPEGSTLPSRESSPVPTPRPSTPPPPLPSPSLTELGLSLTVLTEHLSPSHFSTPPTSGAFLAPHYLLLCHAQGLDVLPLVSPPAPAPYALIRRVSFKSVVVMEHRGVLVAISGRRDGVRVYALDEIKKAVEWRLDVEIRREREKLRREEAKRGPHRDSTSNDVFSLEKISPPNMDKSSSVRSSPSTTTTLASRKGSQRRKAKTPPHTPIQPFFSPPPAIGYPPLSPPPSYMSVTPSPQPLRQRSASSIQVARGRSTSVNDVLRGTISRRGTGVIEMDNNLDSDVKADWMEGSHSDDEAINVVAAGASGSQALDERTSSIVPVESTTSNVSGMDGAASRRVRPISTTTLTPTGFRRATRPSELDLSRVRVEPRPVIPPSPTPTLLTFRQALACSPPPGPAQTVNSMSLPLTESPIPDQDPDDDDENENRINTPTNEPISFAEALLESRLPNLPPPGTRLPQHAILITQSHLVATGEEDVPSSPVSLNSQSSRARQSNDTLGSRRRRRRWSVLDGILPGAAGQPDGQLSTTPLLWESQDVRTREHSDQRPPSSSSPIGPAQSRSSDVAAYPPPISAQPHSRFFSRILGNAFSHRRSEDSAVPIQLAEHADGAVRKQGLTPPPAPAPKLEYVKLPGTKGSIMIKAVETSRKSFLAILCGDNGEKVELFAGTYRTALGLSRTFILPDSPRSLELQLQGDDLVEVFLVFSQNVFGLEPATVRVREVRLGRAERRAARRRARELQVDDLLGSEMDASPTVESTTNVNVRVGLSVPSSVSVTTEVSAGTTPLGGASPSASQPNMIQRPSSGAALRMEDIMPATPQGPYTTFQQLSFSPIFPLAAIVDEYIIPPTYPDFLHYRSVHEPEINGNSGVDLSQMQFSPPGLPVPPVAAPSRWLYRDPKGVVHGPWLSSRMHAWYREALLPPDLPVRREEDTEFVLLKDLRQHCVDPSQPFGPASTRTAAGDTPLNGAGAGKPLLPPISLLSQSRLFGPPSLFFSSRGGHSTTIVDGRGRSVLKDRFLWTPDEVDIDGQTVSFGRLGDVKRLEAFDLQGRSVLVAMRQGGFEAVELSDALLRPADASRDVLPHYTAVPTQMNRRKIFTWRIGSPVSCSSSAATTVTTFLRTPSRYSIPLPSKKSGAPGKSPARNEPGHGDTENDHARNEIMFLGRLDDNVYICERDGETFRILRLAPFGTN